MATKAEWFRYRAERSGPKRPKRPAKRKRNIGVDTAAPGVSATDRKALPRSPSASAGKKAAYALERSEGRPSRRSTRKASNRQRTDVKMTKLRRVSPPHR